MAERGFTLLEIIIVVALIAGVYTFALPQFRIFSGLEVSSTLNRLAVDIRSAWDVAVLTGKVPPSRVPSRRRRLLARSR